MIRVYEMIKGNGSKNLKKVLKRLNSVLLHFWVDDWNTETWKRSLNQNQSSNWFNFEGQDFLSMPQWIWRHFPSFSCFQVLKSCVQNIFNILRWYCAKCNFTGDWSRMGLKRNRPKFGSRHCPLGLTWSNHQENHHHQQISLASLQAITRRISIINKKYLCQ